MKPPAATHPQGAPSPCPERPRAERRTRVSVPIPSEGEPRGDEPPRAAASPITAPAPSTRSVSDASEHKRHEQGWQPLGTTRGWKQLRKQLDRCGHLPMAAPTARRVFFQLQNTRQGGSCSLGGGRSRGGRRSFSCPFYCWGGGAGTHPSFFSGLGAALGHRRPVLADT